jgi:hypothetical protein
VINGKEHRSDVIILQDRVVSWWRKESHVVCPEDLQEVIKEKPHVLIIGTGEAGCAEIEPKARELLTSKGIELIAKPTAEACKIFNELWEEKAEKEKVAAALHLTC